MRKSIEIATILGSRGYFVDYTAAEENVLSLIEKRRRYEWSLSGWRKLSCRIN